MSVAIIPASIPAQYFTPEQEELLMKQFFPEQLSRNEFKVFLYICARSHLDPFLKQIYAIPKFDSGTAKMVVVTSIHGLRSIAERSGNYAPGKKTEFVLSPEGNLVSATAYVRKMTPDGTWHEIEETAYWDEYAQKKKDGTPNHFWKTFGRVMLAKCAEALALRRAFPNLLSGLYEETELGKSGLQTDEEQKLLKAEAVQAIEIEAEKVEDEEETFIQSWGSDAESFRTYLQACYAKKKEMDKSSILARLKANLEATNASFERWKELQKKVA